MGNFANRLKREGLEKELAARQKDYQDVNNKYIRETRPIEKNSFKAELDDLKEDIERIEKEIKELDRSDLIEKFDNLESILNNHCELIKKEINASYKISIYNSTLNKKIPENIKSLIYDLSLRNPQNTQYSCLEKFVGNLIILSLDKEINNSVTLDLKNWLTESLSQNNKISCSELIEKLRIEKYLREEQCNPGLLVAVSEYIADYFVEAWLIKDVNQYIREDALNSNTCTSLKFTVEKKSSEEDNVLLETDQIQTDQKLSNLSKLIGQLIDNLNEQEVDVKQIHIFLPYKLMNYEADCCKFYEDNDELIGEEYQVIIRCSERLRGKNPKIFRWKKKCSVMKSKLNEKTTNEIIILGNEPETKLLENLLKIHEKAIAVKITTTFENEQPGELLWKSSMPIAVWIRKQLPEVDNETELNRLLRNESNSENIYLKDLPTKVTSSRIDASGHNPAESHFGRHICLLWDDPSMLPPEALLTHARLS